MPTPSLDSAQRDSLRLRLLDGQAVLQDELIAVQQERDDAPSRNPHNQVEDSGELGEQRIREAVRDAETGRDAAELREISAALQRIDDGSYGKCVDCGEAIPLPRLLAQPAAARCIGCQERFELAHPPAVRLPPML